MRYWKNIVSLLLSICISACILPGMAVPADAAQEDYRWITDRSEVDGSDFTGSAILAAALNDIFDGNANVYYDAGFTKMVNTELGSSRVPNNGVNKYVGTIRVEMLRDGVEEYEISDDTEFEDISW